VFVCSKLDSLSKENFILESVKIDLETKLHGIQ